MKDGVLVLNGPTPYDVAMQVVAHDQAMTASRAAEAEARRSFLAREYDSFSREDLRDYAVRASEELIELRRRIAWYDDYIRSSSVDMEDGVIDFDEDDEDDAYTRRRRSGHLQHAEVVGRRLALEREAALYADAIGSLPLGH